MRARRRAAKPHARVQARGRAVGRRALRPRGEPTRRLAPRGHRNELAAEAAEAAVGKQTAPVYTVCTPSCSSARAIINHTVGARDGVVGHGGRAAAPVTSSNTQTAAAARGDGARCRPRSAPTAATASGQSFVCKRLHDGERRVDVRGAAVGNGARAAARLPAATSRRRVRPSPACAPAARLRRLRQAGGNALAGP